MYIDDGYLQEMLDNQYQQGRADKYQEIVSEYMLLNEKQVADIRADAIEECKALFRKYILTKEIEGLNELLEQLKEQNNDKNKGWILPF